jgi:competence protein ComEA
VSPVRPPVRVAAILVVLGLAAWVHAVGEREPPRTTAIDCTRALVLDGHLRCGDEAPAVLADLCDADAPVHTIVAGDRIDVAQACAGDPTAIGRMSTDDLRRLAVPIDVNHASIDELRSLPRIGPVLAQRIVDGRPYDSADDLQRVRGIGPKTIANLRARLRF